MRIPLRYNLRSLWVRRVGTVMTIFGIGLTVATVIIMMALAHGLNSSIIETGHENQFIVLRKGALNEIQSTVFAELYQTVRFQEGIARDEVGEPLTSPELTVVINWPRQGGDTANLVVRGIQAAGFKLRPEVRVVKGRRFREGVREIIVSESISKRFRGMRLNEEVEIFGSGWRIVGLFDAGNTAYDSEILGDYEDVAQVWRRPFYNSILLRVVEDSQVVEAFPRKIEEAEGLGLQAVPQKQYFVAQSNTATPVMALGTFVAVMMGIGAFFAAMNMMYGTIIARIQEVATLRALGFKRRSILASFLLESILLTFLGGLLGCALALPIHGTTTGTANLNSFSEVVFKFQITPVILLLGVAFALTVGLLGGFFPSFTASRIKLVDALRQG